jgi:CubicO group peptidase (beta-lactamase class C family)
MFKRFLPLWLAVAVAGCAASSGNSAPAAPVALAAPSDPRVATFARELDALVAELTRDFGAPGVAVALIEDGEVVLERAYGYADVASQQALTPRTRFNTASVSKAFTAWGVMSLVERGAIDLDAPAFDAVTRWRLPASQFDIAGVTTRRLLSHTAGINRGTVGIWGPGDALPTVEASLSGESGGYGDTRLTIEPGTRFNYAGAGYSILQLLVEETSGATMPAYMRAHVLEPLGMRDSEFGWDTVNDPELTYYSEFGGAVPAPRLSEIGAGGLNTTLHDFALFAAAHVASDTAPAGRGVLRPETLALMMSPATATEGRYGLGMSIVTVNGRRLVGHDGGNPGVGTIYYLDPQTRDGIVLMTNRSWGHQVNNPIFCAWRNWSRASGEPESCGRDAVGLVVQTIAAQGMDAGRAHLETLRAERPPQFLDQAIPRIVRQLTYAERNDDALAALRWGTEMAPQSASAHERLGDALLQREDTDGARVHFSEAARLDPENVSVREKLQSIE